MKDEPKWLAGSLESSTKIIKNSSSEAYSSSSNPLTLTRNEYNPPSPTLLRCPIGQKEPKRKEKEKLMEMSSTPSVKYDSLKDDFNFLYLISMFAQDYAHIEGEKVEIERKKVDAKIKKAESNEERLKMNDLQILSKEISNMDTRQLQAHERLCDMIIEKCGIY